MNKEKLSLKGLLGVLKDSFNGFMDDKVTKLGGSLAYSTVFSLAPLLIVIISLSGIFLGREAVEGEVYGQLVRFVGADTAKQLQEIVKNASLSGKSTWAIVIGGITLLIGSTAIFSEIQDSINMIWGIKPKPKRGWLKLLKNRFLSFSIIVVLGFLLLVSLGVNTLVDAFSNRLQRLFPDVAVVIFYIMNMALTIIIVTFIFAIIFKVLPDANIKWRDVLSGALATTLLFLLGKFAISFYISKSSVGTTYGTAGSLVVLLLWVYYSSLILYFGAEFTKAYSMKYGSAIHPNHYAITTKMVEVETDAATIQESEEIVKDTVKNNSQ